MVNGPSTLLATKLPPSDIEPKVPKISYGKWWMILKKKLSLVKLLYVIKSVFCPNFLIGKDRKISKNFNIYNIQIILWKLDKLG